MSKLIATSSQPAVASDSSLSNIQHLVAWFKSAPPSHRVRLIAGRFNNLRRAISWPLLALCFITPWLSWNDAPLVHLDLVSKQFRFASMIFWPEDLIVLTWIMMAGAFGLFFVAMASGRLWCGYACPQTVWTFLFIRLEEMIEGSRHKRLKMDRQPLALNKQSAEKIIRKSIKQFSWLSLSLLTGITFISYFYPLSNMAADFIASDFFADEMSGSGIFWILFIALLTYVNAGFLREQVCTHMCPYSRFQSVMADRSTLLVEYNEERNDCIDCEVCVQVCPTDIDIRDGMQLACIACGACVDACDDIMQKINKPKGLISYRPGNSSIKDALNLVKRPRLIGYALAFILSIFLLINEWQSREIVKVNLERERTTLYRYNANDEIENDYFIKLHNKAKDTQNIYLRINNDSSQQKNFKLSQSHFSLTTGQRQQFPLTITRVSTEQRQSNNEVLQFDVMSSKDNQLLATFETSFIAPR